jgi:hypothetical protein
VQVPCSVVTVRHADPVIFRDHVTSDRQNGLRVYAYPCHLQTKDT